MIATWLPALATIRAATGDCVVDHGQLPHTAVGYRADRDRNPSCMTDNAQFDSQPGTTASGLCQACLNMNRQSVVMDMACAGRHMLGRPLFWQR